jgi:hypothetical protein
VVARDAGWSCDLGSQPGFWFPRVIGRSRDSSGRRVHTVTNTWEPEREVLGAKENKAGGTVVSRFDYSVNATGQRTATSQTGSAFASVRSIAWGYDTLGQLTSAATSDHSADRAYHIFHPSRTCALKGQ